MSWLPSHVGAYPDALELERAWRDLASVWGTGGTASVAGTSVQGRPIPRYEFGRADGPVVLLTGLVHAVELIGSVALLDFVRDAVHSRAALLRDARLVVLPILNPDSLHANDARIAGGRRAFRRGNARGVDLNRNFPRIAPASSPSPRGALSLFSGSRFRLSPYYGGAHPFSEPETRAVRDVAREVKPVVSIGFHSFGNLLLYPWGFTSKPNPRARAYERIGADFRRAQPRSRYAVMQARDLYATSGDMDDWLDAELGTLAFTLEVSRPSLALLRPSRITNPFCWMNPQDVRATVTNSTPGVSALVTSALAA
jgi:carboxypeptidase T